MAAYKPCNKIEDLGPAIIRHFEIEICPIQACFVPHGGSNYLFSEGQGGYSFKMRITEQNKNPLFFLRLLIYSDAHKRKVQRKRFVNRIQSTCYEESRVYAVFE